MHKSEEDSHSNPKCYEDQEFLEKDIEKDKLNEESKEEMDEF